MAIQKTDMTGRGLGIAIYDLKGHVSRQQAHVKPEELADENALKARLAECVPYPVGDWSEDQLAKLKALEPKRRDLIGVILDDPARTPNPDIIVDKRQPASPHPSELVVLSVLSSRDAAPFDVSYAAPHTRYRAMDHEGVTYDQEALRQPMRLDEFLAAHANVLPNALHMRLSAVAKLGAEQLRTIQSAEPGRG